MSASETLTAPAKEAPAFPISVVADEEIDEQVKERAREVLLRAAAHAPRPVQSARVTLRVHRDPARQRPAVAKASLDVGARVVRAHVAAERMTEAIDLLAPRLRRSLEALEEQPRRHRHDVPPAGRLEYVMLRPDERQVVRRKTYEGGASTADQAVVEMEALGHDFHLFHAAETGEDDVVYRAPDGTIGIAHGPASSMSTEDAVERLAACDEPFVFFADPRTGRGNLLYRRYDGNYGLVVPGSR